MSLLSTLSTDSTIKADVDAVSSDYSALESGIYPATVTMAFIQKAESGALGLNLTMKTDAGRELRQTLWMSSGTAKGGKNYYEKDGERFYLPGFNHANALCLLTLGKEISAMDTEVKVISQYSKEAKAEVPTKVDAVTDLLGQEILVALIKQTVDKTRKNESTGMYDATGETKDENEIDKLFRAKDRLTTTEILGKATEPGFINAWEAKWAGKTKMKAKNAGKPAMGSVGGAFGTPANTTKKPATSLFAA
jgi:hypothetical protein